MASEKITKFVEEIKTLTVMELAELVEDVTKEDVVSIARSVECDLIYFLRGLDGEETLEEVADDGQP